MKDDRNNNMRECHVEEQKMLLGRKEMEVVKTYVMAARVDVYYSKALDMKHLMRRRTRKSRKLTQRNEGRGMDSRLIMCRST